MTITETPLPTKPPSGYVVQVRGPNGETRLAQRQDSLHAQLLDLIPLATAAGMYDAADWLKVAIGVD